MTEPTTTDLRCARCGAVAMHIAMTGVPGAEGRPGGMPIDPSRFGIRTIAGRLDLWTALSDVGGPDSAAWTAVASADADALAAIDREIVPVYCLMCRASYCLDHWTTWEVYDPDWAGWFEELRGRCPEGHERRLHD